MISRYRKWFVFYFLLSISVSCVSAPTSLDSLRDLGFVDKERENRQNPNHAKGLLNPDVHPVVVFGGGVGAMTSALYLARAGLHPLVIEGKLRGGLLSQSHAVQNWPGEMEISGSALMEKMRLQAEANGVQFAKQEVISVNFSKRPFVITTRSIGQQNEVHQVLAESCIIAMGTTPLFLKIPGEQEFWGRGVTNCAICDGPFYQDRIVGVVGGGDAAVLEALYLAQIAKEVHLFVRKDRLKANESKRVADLLETPNVVFHYETQVTEIKGDSDHVTGVSIRTGKDALREIALDGLFLAIGSQPNSAIFRGILQLDAKGYIALKKDQETSIEGVYAIGDIVDPVYKQAISAAGDGAKAALQAQQFLYTIQSNGQKKGVLRKNVASKPNPSTQGQIVEIVSSEQFSKEMKEAGGKVIIDFYAPWCEPCKLISEVMELAAHRFSGKVKFLKVNVDQMKELARSYKVRSVPTVLLLDASGAVIERKIGAEQIVQLLDSI